MTKKQSFLLFALVCLIAGFAGQTLFKRDRYNSKAANDRIQQSICEGERASGIYDGPGCAADYPPVKILSPVQGLSRDQMAVKNIHLISAALLLAKCDNFQINKSQIAEYTRQNGVDTEAVRTDSQKYEKQKIYAVEIVKAHAKINITSLCAAIIQDFGPRGKLATGLVSEKR